MDDDGFLIIWPQQAIVLAEIATTQVAVADASSLQEGAIAVNVPKGAQNAGMFLIATNGTAARLTHDGHAMNHGDVPEA